MSPGLVGVVYLAVHALGVCRTNVYLLETDQAALDARAVAEGSSADILWSIVDREVNLGGEDADLDAVLAYTAAEIAKRARALSRHDPDFRIT